MDYIKRTIILMVFFTGVTCAQWLDFLPKKSQGYYTYTVGASVGIVGDYAIINVTYTKIKTSYISSKKIANIYSWISNYTTNFSTMDTALTTDSITTSNRYLFLGNYKYGSEIFYRGVLKTDRDSIYTHPQNNYKFPDIGCLYDVNKYPLVDANNQIIYPGD